MDTPLHRFTFGQAFLTFFSSFGWFFTVVCRGWTATFTARWTVRLHECSHQSTTALFQRDTTFLLMQWLWVPTFAAGQEQSTSLQLLLPWCKPEHFTDWQSQLFSYWDRTGTLGNSCSPTYTYLHCNGLYMQQWNIQNAHVCHMHLCYIHLSVTDNYLM